MANWANVFWPNMSENYNLPFSELFGQMAHLAKRFSVELGIIVKPYQYLSDCA